MFKSLPSLSGFASFQPINKYLHQNKILKRFFFTCIRRTFLCPSALCCMFIFYSGLQQQHSIKWHDIFQKSRQNIYHSLPLKKRSIGYLYSPLFTFSFTGSADKHLSPERQSPYYSDPSKALFQVTHNRQWLQMRLQWRWLGISGPNKQTVLLEWLSVQHGHQFKYL